MNTEEDQKHYYLIIKGSNGRFKIMCAACQKRLPDQEHFQEAIKTIVQSTDVYCKDNKEIKKYSNDYVMRVIAPHTLMKPNGYLNLNDQLDLKEFETLKI